MKAWIIFAVWSGITLAQGPLQRQLPLTNNEANKLYEEHRFDEARALYEKLYKEDPKNGALAYNLGNVYNAMGDTEKAAEFYNEAIKSEHSEAANRGRFNQGTLKMAGNEPQEAIKSFTDYLRANPDDLDAKRNLELAMRMMEKPPEDQQSQDQQDQQENQDQKQEDQQGQSSKDQQDQSQDGQQGQSQDQKDSQGQQQNPQDQKDPQDQQQNPQDQKDPQDQQQSQQDEAKDSKDQKDQQQQGKEGQEQEAQKDKQDSQAKEDDSTLNEQVKKQILDALDQQELNQQQQYQNRKMGAKKRRAKDW